ncbi:DUF2935 domain-containing protein [Paenactinomyces guangxiensis]|uniref:DUF2935 domain-containing protein n=1 Tax=Paenactinomyces guangxiensis TaxID=1490290 RepID=UPI001C69085F|nr:DUF2935 domain-containing protein [Paenactinomyces guangxiensis]
MNSYEQALVFEQNFWLPVLRDHSEFILTALSAKEENEAEQAESYVNLFENLIQTRSTDLDASCRAATGLRKFKLHLLRRLLKEDIAFNLTPTFINHMLNEIDEYLRILSCLMEGKVPPLLHPLHHHLLWLPDASGHATAIDAELDGVEKKWKEKSRQFSRHFDVFYLKSVELAGYLRTKMNRFPALSRFNREVELEIILFQKFLKELEELRLSKEVLGTIAPLMADHMYREECYYLIKLAQVSEVKQPKCSPHP